jgi:signal transduction histidine kinase
LIHPKQLISRPRRDFVTVARIFLFFGLFFFAARKGCSQTTNGAEVLRPKRVLMVFSESRDLPGNTMMEQAAQAEILTHSTSPVEFFTESMDARRFPDAESYRLFRDYIRDRYAGQKLDLAMLFMARNLELARELPEALDTNLPLIFVVVNDQEISAPPNARPFTGIFQRLDISGTIKFIFQLQPETRRVVVVGGASAADQKILRRIEEISRLVDGVEFQFWTNQPVADICHAAKSLPAGTVVLLGTVQSDVTGQQYLTSQVAQMLAPSASVPVYVLGEGALGGGALGGSVIDNESLGIGAGQLALRGLAGTRITAITVELRSNGVPMVDWRALHRWHIKQSRLPAHCVVRYRPRSLWEDHRTLILLFGAGFLAQAMTIAALLVQRRGQRRADLEIQKQRTELAHVTRVATVGQLTLTLAHELSQPLGAIQRNVEAAEIFLQHGQPDLKELAAILTDIRRDNQRAGNVIDRLRSLIKRRSLVPGSLDLRELVEDTVALTQPDVHARQVKLTVDMPAQLPAAQGDPVHVQQVLLNLILNGMDAMSSIPRWRRLMVVKVNETKKGNLQVAVRDHGTGIAPEIAARLFEPFFTTKSNGMGMGLAISRTIIEAHGGDIRVESSALDGTTVSFILPPAGFEQVKPGDWPVTA